MSESTSEEIPKEIQQKNELTTKWMTKRQKALFILGEPNLSYIENYIVDDKVVVKDTMYFFYENCLVEIRFGEHRDLYETIPYSQINNIIGEGKDDAIDHLRIYTKVKYMILSGYNQHSKDQLKLIYNRLIRSI